LGLIPILVGIAVNNELVVYAFSVLMFMIIGLAKFQLDRNVNGILSNQSISVVVVAIAYFVGWAILVKLA
jgi:TM2 domain-containing membrane protein YozV